MVNCAWCRHHRGRIDHPLCSADDMAQRWKDIADAGKGVWLKEDPQGLGMLNVEIGRCWTDEHSQHPCNGSGPLH